MLYRKINKDVFDKLSDELKGFYEEKNGSYVLKVDGDGGDEDPAELRRALERERQDKKDLKKELKDLNDKLEETTGIDAKKRGDIETLEKSWKEKLDKITKEFTDKLTAKDAFIRTTLVDSVATQMAVKLCADKSSIILPHIKARLTADLEGESPATKVLDAHGKVSALTVEDLEKEFVANKDFSFIIVGSKANGSGTSNGNSRRGHGGAPLDASGKPVPFSQMTVQQRVDHIKAKKEASNQGD